MKKPDVQVDIGMRLANMKQIRQQVVQKLNKAFKTGDAQGIRTYSKQLGVLDKNMYRLNDRLKTSRGAFQGWALSIMFFGQMVQRAFTAIWKSSSKTFNEVMHSVANTTTGFDILNGSLTYMRFLAGQALEPVAMELLPIIDGISTWIEENQELFAGIVKLGVVLGTALALIGSFTLAWGGLVKLFGIVKGVLWLVGSAIGAVAAIIGWPFTLISIAAAAALYLIITKWESITGFFSDLGEGIKNIWKTVTTAIGNFFSNLWTGIKNAAIATINFLIRGINKLIGAINLIPGIDLGKIDEWAYVQPKDLQSDKGQATELVRQSVMESPQVNLMIELDGEQVAKSVSTRQQSQFEKYTQGN